MSEKKYVVASEYSDGLMSKDMYKKLRDMEGGSGTVTGVKGDAEETYRDGDVNITKANIGLGNVENKSASDILGEMSSSDIETALGYVPSDFQYIITDTEPQSIDEGVVVFVYE